jgi:threonine/homoserine/homoserine lactone efflux protein
MGLFGIMLSSFLVGLSGALMPGPLTTLTIEQASRLGAGAGLAVALGHSLLELVTVIALALGLGSVLGQPTVAGAVGLVGTLVLAWMGWTTIRSAPAVASATADRAVPAASAPAGDAVPASVPAGDAVAAASAPAALSAGAVARCPRGGRKEAGRRSQVLLPTAAMARGIVVSLANPYWSLWWATIGTTYLGLWGGSRIASLAAFYLGHISSDILWLGLLSLGVARGVRYLSARAYRGVLVALGVFLIGLAAFCLYSAARLLAPLA